MGKGAVVARDGLLALLVSFLFLRKKEVEVVCGNIGAFVVMAGVVIVYRKEI